ncbi:hypothetical protein Hypma_003094 [Hypsizygus marmoreus]|uniref:Uncharacterized protein n=1 Tax=Hypsizygus marmoreus TaxID=39966 RepID=A0A369J6L5_HYPMA|nr:hypothetical protein Hypma_003094 [Hypsizygus marmoreus]
MAALDETTSLVIPGVGDSGSRRVGREEAMI